MGDIDFHRGMRSSASVPVQRVYFQTFQQCGPSLTCRLTGILLKEGWCSGSFGHEKKYVYEKIKCMCEASYCTLDIELTV